MALIVLEGCDGAGKTTIANKLAKVMNAQVIHCTAETPNDLHFFSRIISISEERNIIADRWCYGQFVYQEADERESLGWMDEDDLEVLELKMLENDVKIIHVIAPPEEIAERLGKRAETTEKGIREITDGFEYYLNKSIVPVINWYTGEEQ